MRLVYGAESVQFADRAIEALQAAHIPCVRDLTRNEMVAKAQDVQDARESAADDEVIPATFEGAVPEAEIFAELEEAAREEASRPPEPPEPDDDYSSRRALSPKIRIYVLNDGDYKRASEILIAIGAAPDKPIVPVVAWLIDRAAWWLAALTAAVTATALWQAHH